MRQCPRQLPYSAANGARPGQARFSSSIAGPLTGRSSPHSVMQQRFFRAGKKPPPKKGAQTQPPGRARQTAFGSFSSTEGAPVSRHTRGPYRTQARQPWFDL